MTVYNITVKVDKGISEEWVKWQMNEHIPEVMSTKLFSDFKFFHLPDQNDEDGTTYVIQYFTESRNSYETYIQKYAPGLIKKTFEKWGNKYIAFKTLMQSVQ